MTKVDIKRLDSVTKNDTTATEQINSNFKALQDAIENTLSRNGTGPNYMDADLDMNSYRIINSSGPVEDNDIVNLKYVEERIGGAVEASKTAVSAASQAANSAQSALVSSTNAINALRNAEEQLNNTITYVDEAKESIDEAITTATDEVKQVALDAANEAINDAAATATGIVVEYANNEIKPLLNEIASNAAESAENASESAGLAANESGNAAISATDSQHYAEDSRIWAEGTESEVAALDGEYSSKGWAEIAKISATNAKSYADTLHPETFVKTSGNQTIAGTKTFTGRQIVQSFASDSGGNGFKIEDSNNKGYVGLYEYITSDGSHFARLLNNSYGKNAYIDIQTSSAGVSSINLSNADSMKAKTPSATSNDTNIATTAWVNQKLKVVSALPSSPQPDVFYFIPE